MVNTAQLQPDSVQDKALSEKFSSQFFCRYVYNSSIKQSTVSKELDVQKSVWKNGLLKATFLNL